MNCTGNPFRFRPVSINRNRMHSSFFNILRDPNLNQKDKRALSGNLQSGKRFRFPRGDDNDDDDDEK